MDELSLIIASFIEFILLIIGLVLILAFVIPIPIFLYKIILFVFAIIRDAINGKLAKKTDGSYVDEEAVRRVRELKAWVIMVIFASIVGGSALILIPVIGTFVAVLVFLILPCMIVIRLIWGIIFKK